MLRLKFDENLLKETNNFKLIVDRRRISQDFPSPSLTGPQSSKRASWKEDGLQVQKPSMLPFLNTPRTGRFVKSWFKAISCEAIRAINTTTKRSSQRSPPFGRTCSNPGVQNPCGLCS